MKVAAIGIIILAVITIALTVTLIICGVKEVSERGLKSIIEEVWEGPDAK